MVGGDMWVCASNIDSSLLSYTWCNHAQRGSIGNHSIGHLLSYGM